MAGRGFKRAKWILQHGHDKNEISFVRKKESMSMPGTLVATDMMPLINKSWENIFAVVSTNKTLFLKEVGLLTTGAYLPFQTFEQP